MEARRLYRRVFNDGHYNVYGRIVGYTISHAQAIL